MASAKTELKSEIQSWLQVALKEENLKDIFVNILGNTEKGDGYLGDIVFIDVVGTTNNGSSKSYSLALKCSKRSKVLRESVGVQPIFLNEINLCKEIVPALIKFQKEKGLTDLFDSVPKCYGAFTGEDMEVIVLENLRALGYELWPKKVPQNKNHIYFNIKKYAQLHATSAAISKEKPELFQKWVNDLDAAFKRIYEDQEIDFDRIYGTAIEEAYELLKNDLDEKILLKWRELKKQVYYIFVEMHKNSTEFKVITHGDCWNNNFMFYYDKDNKDVPAKVAFLDWQVSKYSSPIFDLSYHIFSCASQKEFENINDILTHYHNSFIEHLEKLDVKEPNTIYPFEQFLNDWKEYAKLGIVMAALLMKICATDKEEVEDIMDVTESGRSIEDTFQNEIQDKDTHKNRIRPVIEHAVKYDLI